MGRGPARTRRAGAQRGDHDAFAVLAGLFVARLDAAARLILRDHDLARDAVQDGFIRPWRSLPSLRDPNRFEGWLRSLVARSCIDILRRRGRRPIEVELTSMDGPSVSDVSVVTANHDLLDDILRRLSPDQRAVVVLRYYFDLEVPEIAATLRIPADAAWAPDSRSVLARFETGGTTSELWVLDATGRGGDQRLEVDVPYLPAWQRVAAQAGN